MLYNQTKSQLMLGQAWVSDTVLIDQKSDGEKIPEGTVLPTASINNDDHDAVSLKTASCQSLGTTPQGH